MLLQEVKDYLKIDYSDEDTYLEYLIEASIAYVEGLVGTGYKSDELGVKLADLLQKKIIHDLYMDRGTQITIQVKEDRITRNLIEKLSLIGDD